MSAGDTSFIDSLRSPRLPAVAQRAATQQKTTPHTAEKTGQAVGFAGLWRSAKLRFVASGRGLALVHRDLLIVGADEAAREMRNYLGSLPQFGYRFRGFIGTAGSDVEAKDDVAGHLHELVDVARSMFVDEIIISSHPPPELLADLCEQAREYQINLRYVPSAYERRSRPNDIRYIGSLPTIVAYERPGWSLSLVCKQMLDPFFNRHATLDSMYIDKLSIWLNVKLLLRTFRIVFRGTGV